MQSTNSRDAWHVRGVVLDPQTRCQHYHSVRDIVALRMYCCGHYYACRECHDSIAQHPAQLWPPEQWHQRAVLCGNCGTELTIAQYMAAADSCPHCAAEFNPGCRNHYPLYFDCALQDDTT